jgi:hypothetical protein
MTEQTAGSWRRFIASPGGAVTSPGSLHPIHFSGATSILIAAGGEAISDPVCWA